MNESTRSRKATSGASDSSDPSARPRPNARRLVQLSGVLVVILLIPYINALQNGFVWLDQHEILDGNLIIASPHDFIEDLVRNDGNFSGYHRPLYNLAHSVDRWIWDDNAAGYHGSSVLLHLSNVVLAFLVLACLTRSTSMAFLVAATWGLLPVNTAAVSLIHSKADLLVTFFLAAAIGLILATSERSTTRGRLLFLCLASICYGIALLSKETAIMLAVVALYLCLDKRSTAGLQSSRRLFVTTAAVFSVIAAGFVTFRFAIASVNEPGSTVPLLDRAATFIPVYSDYVTRSLTGIELTTNDAVPIWRHDPTFPRKCLLFFVIVALQAVYFVKVPACRKGILWFNAFLLPVSQLYPILHFRADRFLYLPSLGFIVFLAEAVRFHIPEERRARLIRHPLTLVSLIVLFSGFSFRIWDRNHDFKTNRTLFEPVIERYPDNREAQSVLAREYLNAGEYAKAANAFKLALTENPNVISFVNLDGTQANFGVLQLRTRNFHHAYEIFRTLREAGKNTDPELGFNQAVCALNVGRYEEARTLLLDYLRVRPTSANGRFLLGRTALMMRRFDEALAAFTSYLQVHPDAADRAAVEEVIEGLRHQTATPLSPQ
ncbi:MAG: tetratricopeptide repeat protein [Myxococcales bacterium]|nr:tetratricopeptide repeat protein [Myxococcales bacterium]